MAATSIPQLIAYAESVGYPGYRGLSTAGFPLLAWGVATGSPYLNSGVTSLTALMAKSDLDGEAYVFEHGEDSYVELVAAYSLWIGVASLALAASGFPKLTEYVPKPVRFGFKWGCAVGVLVSAIPNGILKRGSKELKSLVSNSNEFSDALKPFKANFPGGVNVASVLYALLRPELWALAPTILFVCGTAFIMEGKKYMKKYLKPEWCPPGTEVVLLTAASILYSIYFDYDAATVGSIPKMNPNSGINLGGFYIPIEFVDLKKLVTEVPLVDQFGGSYLYLAVSACIFSAVNFLSIVGIASTFESEDGIPWSAERELAAQGVSCCAAAAVGSAPVSGSLSRSMVSRMTGTTSQWACIITALCWIYLQPYMSIMSPCPKAALSAVIVSAVLKGIAIPKDLLKQEGLDKFIGWGTGILTATTSPTNGFGAGMILFFVLKRQVPKPKKKDE